MLRLLIACCLALPLVPFAQDWGPMATISSTMGINGGRLCLGETSRGDLGCPTYAPSVTAAGHVSVTGNLSATKFIGDGSGLTGVTSSGDRITSSTTGVTANSTGYISLTTAGTTTGYFTTAGLLVLPGISTTSLHGISSTNGYFSGKIGIGVAPLSYGFQMAGDGGGTDDMTLDAYTDTASNSPLVQIRRARGTSTAATAPQANDMLGVFRFAGYNGSSFTNVAAIYGYAEGDFSVSTTRSSSLRFSTTNANSFAERMRINPDGNVGIGTMTPKATLEVSGSISLGSGALYMPYRVGSDSLATAYTNLIALSGADSSLLTQTSAVDVGLSNQETILMLADNEVNNDDGFSIVRWNNSGFHSIPFRMRGSGYIGLNGILLPSYPLDVSGTVRATTFIGDGSNLTNLTGDNLGDHTATTTIKSTNGTVALPGYTWTGDTNTGFYWVGADQIGATVGGIQQLLIRTTGLTISGSVLVNNVGDTAAAPSYSWSGDTNTGFYWPGADNLAATTGGAQRMLVNSAGITVIGRVSTTGLIDAGGAIYGYQGDSVTAPGYTWSGDTNTGMYWVGADQIGVSTGGVQQLLIKTTGLTISGSVLVNNVGDIATAPSYSWSGDTNTGFYWVGADQIGVSTGGVQQLLIRTTGLTISGSVLVNNVGDTAAAPSYSWSGDTNTGLYWVGSDQIGISTGGVQQLLVKSTGLTVSGSVLANNVGDTAAAPSYSWSGDTNTGFYWAASDQIGVSTGGAQRLLLNSTGATVTGKLTTTGIVDAGGSIYGNAGDSVTAPGYTWSGDTNTGMYWVAADQLGITTGGAQRLLVNNAGASVTGKLDVTGVITGSDLRVDYNVHVEDPAGEDDVSAPSTNFNDGLFQLVATNSTSGLKMAMIGDSNEFQAVSQTTASAAVASSLYLNQYGGIVAIGSTSFGANLLVRGTVATCTLGNGTGSTACTSDRRLKQDIQPLQGSLEKIAALQGVHFKWKKDPSATRIGLIAQDVEKQFPEVVETDPETGMKAVAYPSLVAPLIEAVKELKAENTALKASNDNLRLRLERLESRIK